MPWRLTSFADAVEVSGEVVALGFVARQVAGALGPGHRRRAEEIRARRAQRLALLRLDAAPGPQEHLPVHCQCAAVNAELVAT